MSHGAPISVTVPEPMLPEGHFWRKLPVIGSVVGCLGLLASLGLFSGHADQFFFSWLVAFLFFLTIAIGGLFFVLIHFATKAGWSVAVRRIAENAMGTFPMLALLFLPIAFGMQSLFIWSQPEVMAHDALLQAKSSYLNQGFFFIRAAIFFIAWIGLGRFYLSQSRRQDQSGDHDITRRLQRFSGPALIVAGLTTSFAATDWIMSLDPHWFSTMFGVYLFSGSLVAIYAFMAITAIAIQRAGFLKGIITTEHLHDLGKLLFGFTCFWAYIGFSQYFLIWYANIPEETVFYLHRNEGSWRWVTLALAVGHFCLPFVLMLPRGFKRKPTRLLVGSFWLLLMHYLDLHWLVMPNLHHHGAHASLLDLTTFVAVGGFFIAAFSLSMRAHALLPIGDPRLPESVSFENM